MPQLNYGIDAPKVIRNLLIIGFVLFFGSFFLNSDLLPSISRFLKMDSFYAGISLLFTGFLMLMYAKFGKFKQRDRIINLYTWKGNEQVLDVGTGLGLLMIGVAKKLTTGKSVGIDIFNQYDLSGNTFEQTKVNTELENVSDKTEILSGNIIKTNLSDNCFDVIVSNLCLHNIYKAEERKQACWEINRILKPGGKIIISDFKNTREYKKNFEMLGMTVQKMGTFFLDTFPPLTIIIAEKKIS